MMSFGQNMRFSLIERRGALGRASSDAGVDRLDIELELPG